MKTIGTKDGIRYMITTDDMKTLAWFAEWMDTTEYVS